MSSRATWMAPARNVSSPGAGVRRNGWLRGRVAYVIADIVNNVCPYRPSPLSVVYKSAFSLTSLNSSSSSCLSGVPVMMSMPLSFLGNPVSNAVEVGAVCCMLLLLLLFGCFVRSVAKDMFDFLLSNQVDAGLLHNITIFVWGEYCCLSQKYAKEFCYRV